VPETGIVDFTQVAEAFAAVVAEEGGVLRTSTEVEDVSETEDEVEISTNRGTFRARSLVNCAGLHSDRVALLCGVEAGVKIVPFRGEYYELKPEKRHLVKNIVYPLPDPSFPFLNVHLTRTVEGGVEAGPNAVLGLAREGYRKTDINIKDSFEALTYPGLWRLARTYWRTGIGELVRSFSRKVFTRSLKKLIPEVEEEDLAPIEAGVRAQALAKDGVLVNDFLIVDGKRSVHVLNAPSPAATAAIPIGKTIAERITERRRP
jgi:L-2-hydroxyglutarate oxidase